MKQVERKFAETGDLWPSLEEQIGKHLGNLQDIKPEGVFQRFTRGYLRELLKRRLTMGTLLWELADRNEVTEALARQREGAFEEMLGRFRTSEGVDLPAITAIILSGLTLLALRSQQPGDEYFGISLGTEQGWGRILEANGRLVRLLFEHCDIRNIAETPQPESLEAKGHGRARG